MNTKTLLSDFARRLSLHPGWLVFAGVFLLTLAVQRFSGAVDRPFYGHPDAPSHAVSSLLVRNYLLDGMPTDPIAYAKQLYGHYPKVSIGYWPPAFYGVSGVWLLLFGISGASFLAFYATVCGVMALLLWQSLENRLGPRPAMFAVAMLFLLALTSKSLYSTMLELPLALFVFASTIAFVRFLRRPTLGNSLLFAVLSSLAILTKGNAYSLALLPPIALLLTREFSLIRSWQLWLSAIVVSTLTLPWYLHFAKLATSGFSNLNETAYLQLSGPFYLQAWWSAFGVVGAAAAFAGLGLAIRHSLYSVAHHTRQSASPAAIGANRNSVFWAVMASAILGFLLFHTAVRSGTEVRYWYTVLGPACALAGLGYARLEAFLQRHQQAIPASSLTVLAAAGLLLAFSLPWRASLTVPTSTTIPAVSAWIAQHRMERTHTVLVCCNGMAEGEMIATLAFRFPQPGDYLRVVRSSHMQGMTEYRRPRSMTPAMGLFAGPIDFRGLPITAAYVAPVTRKRPLISTPVDDRWQVIGTVFRSRPDLWLRLSAINGFPARPGTAAAALQEEFFILNDPHRHEAISQDTPRLK